MRILLFLALILFGCKNSNPVLELNVSCKNSPLKKLTLQKGEQRSAIFRIEDIVSKKYSMHVNVYDNIAYLEFSPHIMCSVGLPEEYNLIDTCGFKLGHFFVENGFSDIERYKYAINFYDSLCQNNLNDETLAKYWENKEEGLNYQRKKFRHSVKISALPLTIIHVGNKTFYGAGSEMKYPDGTKKLNYHLFYLIGNTAVGIAYENKLFDDLETELQNLICMLNSLRIEEFENNTIQSL